MSTELIEVLSEAGRLLFLGLFPLIAIVVLGSLLSTVLQASIAVQDHSIGFGIRFISLLIGLYLFLPSIISSLLELAQMSYGA
jgi:type III secretory pathway component EscS